LSREKAIEIDLVSNEMKLVGCLMIRGEMIDHFDERKMNHGLSLCFWETMLQRMERERNRDRDSDRGRDRTRRMRFEFGSIENNILSTD
jgi:hypothetical protein